MRIYLTLSCLTILLIGMPSHAETRCPPDIKNYIQCSRYLESVVSREFPDLIIRNGPSLTIRIGNGKNTYFKDILDTGNSADVRIYNVVQYFPSIQYVLLEVSFYEGGTCYLINTKNGKQVEVGGRAILSPDNQRLLIWHMDIEAEYSQNVLEIYNIVPNGLVKEFSEVTTDWGPSDVQWVDSHTIIFNKNFWEANEISKVSKILGRDIDSKKDGSQWHIR